MSTTRTDNSPRPERPDEPGCLTESLCSIDVYDDGPFDTTVRPAPPNTPFGAYPRVEIRRQQLPEAGKESEMS